MRNKILVTATVFLILGGIIFLSIISWIIFDKQYFNWTISSIDLENASRLGSFLSGIVGALWSAAGVLFVYAIFKEQQKAYIAQNFENTFFNLLSTYHQIVNNTTSKIGNGREFYTSVLKLIKNAEDSSDFIILLLQSGDIIENNGFLELYRKKRPYGEFTMNSLDSELQNMYATIMNELEYQKVDRFKFEIKSDKYIELQYQFVYEKYHEKLGHYFRFIYNIFKYTIEERGGFGDAQRYINLIQAQMSNDELGLLFYNALSINSLTINKERKFYNWLNEYNFFENIDSDSLIDYRHSKFYPNNKFKFNN